MNKRHGRVLPLVIGALLCATPLAAQQVVTFETLSCDGNAGNVGTVDGVSFSTNFTCYSAPQDPYNAHSGTNRVYTSNSTSGTFTFSSRIFSGAYFAGYDIANVHFDLFNDALLVATSGSLTLSSTPTFLGSGYNGFVNRVTVTGNNPDFIMDDVTFGRTALTSTPEPASLVLLGTGLLGVFGVVRRKRTTSAS